MRDQFIAKLQRKKRHLGEKAARDFETVAGMPPGDFIRRAAIGDPLVAWSERVDRALQGLLASRTWTGPQKDWLRKIAAQTRTNLLVDRESLDDPDQLFRREGGGFARLDRLFEGHLQEVLDSLNETLWRPAA